MSKAAKNYSQMRTELDEIMSQLQSTDVDVDEAIKLYERGMKLVADIEKYLETARNKVEKIKTNLDA